MNANEASDKLKAKASVLVSNAIKKGLLARPTHCTKCGEKKKRIIGHHENYAEPLNVEWLCDSCHRFRHFEIRGYWPIRKPRPEVVCPEITENTPRMKRRLELYLIRGGTKTAIALCWGKSIGHICTLTKAGHSKFMVEFLPPHPKHVFKFWHARTGEVYFENEKKVFFLGEELWQDQQSDNQ